MKFNIQQTDALIKAALKEDLGKGDITSNTVIPKTKKIKAQIRVRSHGVVCGIDIVKRILELHDKKIKFKIIRKDGSFIQKNEVIAEMEGKAISILAVERVMLNFLAKLSGVATTANRFVAKILPYRVRLLDTRKTTPGFRMLEKYAVAVGGGMNHRIGLYDMFLVKDNHIKIVGNIGKCMEKIEKINKSKKAKKSKKKEGKLMVEIEIESLQQLNEILKLKKLPDRVMLDNLSYEEIEICVEKLRKKDKKLKIEASGGVTLENISEIAKCKVDYISVGGALTLGAKPLDYTLDVILV